MPAPAGERIGEDGGGFAIVNATAGAASPLEPSFCDGGATNAITTGLDKARSPVAGCVSTAGALRRCDGGRLGVTCASGAGIGDAMDTGE